MSQQDLIKPKESFAHEIFKQDLLTTYQEQTAQRNLLMKGTADLVRSIIRSINTGTYENVHLESMLRELSAQLHQAKGKKVYIPFTEEQRKQVRQTDLVAFLRQCGEIVKPSGFEFQWNNDGQKITIRGNVWYNQYEQFGGDVISFTQYFYDYSYQDVVCLMPKSSPRP